MREPTEIEDHMFDETVEQLDAIGNDFLTAARHMREGDFANAALALSVIAPDAVAGMRRDIDRLIEIQNDIEGTA